MNFDLESITGAGIDLKTGFDYTGGQDRYVSALQRYYKSSESNMEKIRDFLNKEDTDNLEILFHAIKSNSLMIGALSLSDRFALLETSSRDGDLAAVNSNIKETLDEYEKILEVLKPLGEMERLKAEGELTGEEAKVTADKLLAALDDFSDDLASELISKLAGYPFRITQMNKLRKAADLINDFMYDDAAELIEEIIPSIE
ncbi:MAG: Hpt domain-containing protein [Lachnospiraceae bacterium]|nr:Hpt domain-containing protein [Lachnospiraceae bacterium]